MTRFYTPLMASHDKARVLVVDDMADVADAMASLLELDGYEVRIASLDNSGRTTLLCTRLRNDGALPRERLSPLAGKRPTRPPLIDPLLTQPSRI